MGCSGGGRGTNAAINGINSAGRLYAFDFDWAIINNVGTVSYMWKCTGRHICGSPISICEMEIGGIALESSLG